MQIEFAVLLIREHFKLNSTEGGNWLLRYGSPEDGLSRQYTFGIEAIVRMILLDEKLVRGLRSEVDCSIPPAAAAFSSDAVHCIILVFLFVADV